MFEQPLNALAPYVVEKTEPEAGRFDVVVDRDNLVAAVKGLCDLKWGYLSAITGLDLGAQQGELEVLYHFCEGALVLTLRVRVPRDNAEVPSLWTLIPPAQLYEQELAEMLGVRVIGLRDSSHLYLPDDWESGVYPLRKDAPLPERKGL